MGGANLFLAILLMHVSLRFFYSSVYNNSIVIVGGGLGCHLKYGIF